MKPKKMILCLIPNDLCNLKCKYCYISQIPEGMKQAFDFTYDVEYIAKCLSPERLGGPCIINLTGRGETMLQKGIVKLCQLLLEQGHYIELVTNLTATKVLNDFLKLPNELLEHLEYKISFHYKELKERKMLEHFFGNVDKVQKSPSSFTLELMPTDDIVDDIDDIIDICYKKVGAKCQLTVGRADYLRSRTVLTQLPREEYIKIWSKFDSPMFETKMNLVDVKRKEFCYAGAWTLRVNLYTGEAQACYNQPYKQNIFENPSKPIKFCAVGKHCMEPFCYNGHAHISLGVIPELEAPTYFDIRNRKRLDGSEWFNESTKEFFSTKLYDTNKVYTPMQKVLSNIQWYTNNCTYALKHPEKIIRKLKFNSLKKKNEK